MIEGFLLINKPAHMTSFSCVGKIKRLVGKGIRVGHAGTLDRFATGLLVIAIGRNATKQLGLLLNASKKYVATGRLGQLTDTLDPMGSVISTIDLLVDQLTLQKALVSFGDGYLQVPPVYSALKFAGQRLSDLYRASQDLENLAAQALNLNVNQIAQDKCRQIKLYQLDLVSFDFPHFKINAHVSSGTYIRVLVNDIAQKINSCATTIELCREAIGPFELDQALDLTTLTLDLIQTQLLSLQDFHAKLSLGA